MKEMTSDQYFDLRNGIIDSKRHVQLLCSVFLSLGIILISIGILNINAWLITIAIAICLCSICIVIISNKKKKDNLDWLLIKYSTGESFEHAGKKLGLLEYKIVEKPFQPSICESV